MLGALPTHSDDLGSIFKTKVYCGCPTAKLIRNDRQKLLGSKIWSENDAT